MTNGGWGEGVQHEGVRPDYGLSTVTGIGQLEKSPYERTMRPGETRTPENIREMLGEVILAAGAAALPGAVPQSVASRPPGGKLSPSSRGQQSQIRVEREMARSRAMADDLKFGYTRADGSKVLPGPVVRLRKPNEPGAEKFSGEVTILGPGDTPVKFNIWRDPDGGHYAQVQQTRTPLGYSDSFRASNLGEMQALKGQALLAFSNALREPVKR